MGVFFYTHVTPVLLRVKALVICCNNVYIEAFSLLICRGCNCVDGLLMNQVDNRVIGIARIGSFMMDLIHDSF